MKRFTAVVLAALCLAALCACGVKKTNYDREGYKAMFDIAVNLPRDHSREKIDRIFPASGTDYLVTVFSDRGRNYLEELDNQYNEMHAEYAEKYGDDYAITYEVVNAVEKDKAGIEQYKNYDSHYFDVYGVDTDAVQAVTFVTVKLRIEGSKDSYEREKTLQCFCIDGNWYSFYSTQLPTKLG